MCSDCLVCASVHLYVISVYSLCRRGRQSPASDLGLDKTFEGDLTFDAHNIGSPSLESVPFKVEHAQVISDASSSENENDAKSNTT